MSGGELDVQARTAPGAYQSIVTQRTPRSWSSRRRDALDLLIREGFRTIGVRSRLNSSLKRLVPRCERAFPVGKPSQGHRGDKM